MNWGTCRLCGQRRLVTHHHLVPMRWLRQGRLHLHDPARNLIALCARCHRLVESHVKNGGLIHRGRLRAVLSADEIDYARDVYGRDRFDFFYPVDVR